MTATGSKKQKARGLFKRATGLLARFNALQNELKAVKNKLERTEFEAKLFREINTALTSTFELQEILPLILQVMTTLVNTQGVSIALVNEEDKTLRIAESYGLDPKDIENFYIYYARINTGPFKEVMEKKSPSFFGPENNLYIPLLMSVPLVSRNKVIGFVNIHSMYQNKSLTPDKIALVNALASQASIAISNAQLFNAMKEQATIDPCTNLFNFRYFQQKLDEEINKAAANGTALSLIILDIDFFKKVNDTYGHLYGDQVLHEISKILKSNVRSEDTVCRYGGEEFAIIFPNCTQKIAERIAERIRAKIEETTANDRRGIFKSPVTVSVGVAEYTPDINKTMLIHRADCSLYYAKNTGRNRVCGYDANLETEYEKYLPKNNY
ncbi:diguanylate cyclase [Thermincola ferriacetica]|uniref:Diguanylate cyclase n=1 Tax=Thermincola ferriacetica TaxID=281456 RepID=A0A0L6W7Z9_9FIRM|nr:sensor domain-containing diguanylate cyclase [Thermincola ferriacetica]KNZ71219.1 diguanylate cyclase [Thermincola ferriacetica]